MEQSDFIRKVVAEAFGVDPDKLRAALKDDTEVYHKCKACGEMKWEGEMHNVEPEKKVKNEKEEKDTEWFPYSNMLRSPEMPKHICYTCMKALKVKKEEPQLKKTVKKGKGGK